jgi:hypothetical protein
MMTTPRTHTRLFAIVAGMAAGLVFAAPARADQIDRVIVQDAPFITQAVRDLKVKNVSVLKFRVKFGEAPPAFQGGTEGIEMLHRLENILVLGLDPDNPAYTVLAKAGQAATAASKAGKVAFDWSTPEGRKRLFELKLPVLWDDRELRTADAFITGTVLVAKDFRDVKIELIAFTKADPTTLKTLRLIQDNINGTPKGIHTDRAMLASLGQTFSTTRRLPQTVQSRSFIAANEEAVRDALNRENAQGAATTLPDAGPVKLEILYDGKPAIVEPDEQSKGEFKVAFRIPKGSAGQRVTFTLENTSTDKLAVLLCVDGKNTIAINGESLDVRDKPPAQFRMYVLDAKMKYEIPGFLTDAASGAVTPLVVAERQKGAELYDAMSPETRGKIQMFVFGPRKLAMPPITPEIPNGKAKDQAPLGNDPETKIDGAFQASGLSTSDSEMGTTRNLRDAQERVLKRSNLALRDGKLVGLPRSREIIIPESTKNAKTGKVEIVNFVYSEQPLDSLVITYYTP